MSPSHTEIKITVVYSGEETEGGANAEMALGGEFAWHTVEVEKYFHRHLSV